MLEEYKSRFKENCRDKDYAEDVFQDCNHRTIGNCIILDDCHGCIDELCSIIVHGLQPEQVTAIRAAGFLLEVPNCFGNSDIGQNFDRPEELGLVIAQDSEGYIALNIERLYNIIRGNKNPHIELVKKWLADPKSVSQEELHANRAVADYANRARAAADDAYDADAARAAYAADAAYRAADDAAVYWVKKFEELSK